MDRVEFWLIDEHATRNGERPDQPGHRVKTLMHVADLFARYCESPETIRPSILGEIAGEQKALLNALRQ